jgi:hypothetical protein
VTAEFVKRTISCDQTKHAVSDEAVEKMDKQLHRQRSFPNISDDEFRHNPVHAQRTGMRTVASAMARLPR